MHRKNWGDSAISISILVWMSELLSLLPVFSLLPVAAGEQKTYLFAIVPQVLPLEIKRDWAKKLTFPSPIVFAASLYMQTLLRDIVHKHNKETAITDEAVNATTFTVTIPTTAIATGEAPTWS